MGKTFKATPKSKASDDSDPPEDTRPSSLWSKTVQDVITFSKSLEGLLNGSECVGVVRFSEGKWLSLSQITVLARCVNSLRQTHSPFEENSYLFAHLVVETAKLIDIDHKAELMSKRKRGKWMGLLPVTNSEPHVIQKVKLEYDKLWVKFNEDIDKSINNENSGVYKAKHKEAERLAAEREEERHKREEAEEEIKRLRAQIAASAANGAISSS